VDRAFADAHAVVHLAALGSVPRSVNDPVASHVANANGTLTVLEGARRHGNLHTIVASSSSVYGANPTLPKHEQLATRPMSPYAATKLATESYTLAWQQAYGLPTLAFRFFNVFGPLQPAGHAYAAVIPAFIDAALRGDPLTVHGDGTQSRDFTYVDTVTGVLADALVRTVTDPEPVNLAYGSRITLLEVIAQLEALLGRPLERRHTPTRAGDVPHSQADSSKVQRMFAGVQPTPFPEGLAATLEWMTTVVG
jgi:UDP-glucose 4-epimerase